MPDTGYLFNDHCYASQLNTYHAYGASLPANLSALYDVEFTWWPTSNVSANFSGSYGKVTRYYDPSTGVFQLQTAYTVKVPVWERCDPAAAYLDGITIGWGIGLIILAVTAVGLLRKALPA